MSDQNNPVFAASSHCTRLLRGLRKYLASILRSCVFFQVVTCVIGRREHAVKHPVYRRKGLFWKIYHSQISVHIMEGPPEKISHILMLTHHTSSCSEEE